MRSPETLSSRLNSWEKLEFHVENWIYLLLEVFCNVITLAYDKLPEPLRRTVNGSFVALTAITPDVPISLRKLSGGSRGRSIFRYGFLAGLFLCFGLTSIFAIRDGVWMGHDPSILYFVNDHTNLFNYLLLCPIYVGLCSWMISLLLTRMRSITELQETLIGTRTDADPAEKSTPRNRNWANSIRDYAPHFYIFVGAIFVFAAVLTQNYIADQLKNGGAVRIVNPASVQIHRHYWFVDVNVAAGKAYLNGAGVYYSFLNFILLFITALAVMSFIRLFIETVGIGRLIELRALSSHTNFSDLKAALSVFTEAYIVAKILCVIYIINVLMWRRTALGNTSNVWVAIGFIAVMALFFISFPRYYVEKMWHNVHCAEHPEDKIEKLPDAKSRLIALVADGLIVGLFIAPMEQEILAPVTKLFHVVQAQLSGWFN